MDRAKFVHVVALVRARSGIHEREHARNEQGALVVSHRERSCKDGASLAVLALAVAEKQRVGGRICVAHLAALPHKASLHHRTVLDLASALYYKIVKHHSVAYVYGR